MTILALLLGVAILAQFRAHRRVRVVASDREAQILLLTELVEANADLRAEVRSLESQVVTYGNDSRGAALQRLVDELNRVRVLNGLVEVSGPGLELRLDGPLSSLDLQDLVNELRNAGGEAISLNGHRLVATSAVTVETEGQLMVDGHSISRPYIFQAIGDPDTLESALLRPGGLVDLQRRGYPTLSITSTPQTRLVLGIHRPQSALVYARPVD